jgi:hypothetical protein
MSEIKQICGTCRYWQQEERGQVGSISTRVKDPLCKQFKKIKYPEDKPESWCWKVADIFDLVNRQRAGLIEGEFE